MIKGRLEKKIRDYCDKKYSRKIEIYHDPSVQPLINNRCQMNAIARVQNGQAVAVVECLIIHKNSATLHYINIDDQGRYVDVTLGWEYSGADYRLIRIMRDFNGGWSSDHLDREKLRIAKEAIGMLHKLYDTDRLL